jgi:virginiamycin B lyase
MFFAALAAGCGGTSSTVPHGAGGGGATPAPSPTPVPLPASAATSIPVGPSATSASLGPVLGGYSDTITVPAASGAAALAVTLSATQPGGTPAVQTVKRRAQSIGGSSVAPVAFVTMTSSATVTLGAAPAFSFTLPAGSASLGQICYVALYDPTASPQPGWTAFEGPGTVSGSTITFTAPSAGVQLTAGVTYDLVLFTVTSALPSPTPTATPSPTPTPVATLPPSHGTVIEYPVPASADPLAITAGPDGNLWFTTTYDIGKITTNGTVTLYTIPSGYAHSVSIVTGPDGNLWFAESGSAKIGKITTNGVITEYPVTVPARAQLNAIAAGPDGNLWFTVEDLDFSTQYQVEHIGKITTAGAITEYPGPSYSVHLQGITAGADSNLWFTQSNGYIGKITTAGTATQYGVPLQPNLGVITPGPGGLWYSAQGLADTGAGAYGDVGFIDMSGKVTHFEFSQHYYGPGIAAGPDGNLWLGEMQGYNIAKMTPSGTLVEYAVPSHSNPLYVTAGPDGNVWFTTRPGTGSTLQGSIGKIVP